MESSGVPVVFETCETLVLLDRGRIFPKESLKWDGNKMKQDDSGTGEGVLTLVQLEKNSNTRIQVSSILKQHLVLAEIHLDFDMDLGFKFLVGGHGWLHVSFADRLVSSQI